MSEECSAVIANGLEKQKDPGCPTIPCSVGSFNFEKALCDLGESVSVMPRDVFEKLRLPLEPTGMCLELGDNSIRYPLGIAEDVPVKVGHHFIPVGQGRPQFNASSSIPNSGPLRIQMRELMDEQAKINKDTVTKFKTIDKVLENIDSKVMEVGSSNHQVLNMMKMLETQVGQLAGRLTNDEGKLPGQPKGPESAKAIQTCSGKETEDPEHPVGARKPKPSAEVEGIAKEKVTGIVVKSPNLRC
jgi:hypothetical protein